MIIITLILLSGYEVFDSYQTLFNIVAHAQQFQNQILTGCVFSARPSSCDLSYKKYMQIGSMEIKHKLQG